MLISLYLPLYWALQICKVDDPLEFPIVELKPPKSVCREILCRCETSFAHASLCLKYHAVDRTSTIIIGFKICSENIVSGDLLTSL